MDFVAPSQGLFTKNAPESGAGAHSITSFARSTNDRGIASPVPCRLQIDNQLKNGRLFDRKVGGPRVLQ